MPMSSRLDAGVTKRGVRGEEATRAAIANVVTAKSDLPSECQRLPAVSAAAHLRASHMRNRSNVATFLCDEKQKASVCACEIMNKHERLHSFIGSFIERKSRGVVASQQQQRLFTFY